LRASVSRGSAALLDKDNPPWVEENQRADQCFSRIILEFKENTNDTRKF